MQNWLRKKLSKATETDCKILHDPKEGWYYLFISTIEDDEGILFAESPWVLRICSVVHYWRELSLGQMVLVLLSTVISEFDPGDKEDREENREELRAA